ncbi:sucrose-6-phosphate hydrolase [Exiguobacterium sp. KRL4]|uniref:glycoside hydrolase family 32 protein n=1 Tax=Exiguobacterium sp. KRL4 TaxID=1914536 RepID=UPI0008F8FC9D|nr:sucrose-6-phosphate hydrolase [Exiguobacterium sp. KRL4]OIN68308.1 sucrose-6-phosphate hydrolase [Exiguobacterium sp. KRL4]
MNQWTREARYRPLSDLAPEVYQLMKEEVRTSPWRFSFHIQPPTGLLNDPNGFVYHDGTYHLFYQWFPLGPVHGLKYWYHLTSKDLVHWFDEGAALIPNDDPDSHGAYSGSGFVKDDKVHIMYTGNKRDQDWVRHTSQIVGHLRSDGRVEKHLPPAIATVPDGYTEHFRDPKVFQHQGTWYCIIGAQRNDLTGSTVVYHSEDAESWTLLGELETRYPDFGYMWECPDYFELDGHGLLLFSPQGIEPTGDHYQNIFQSGYFIGQTVDFPNLSYQHEDFLELDFGFDFYAPQTTLAADGRRILVGWMGLPDITYPSDRYKWAHALTLPRELTLEQGHLRQKPVRELTSLRKDTLYEQPLVVEQQASPVQAEVFELVLSHLAISSGQFELKVRASEQEETILRYDTQTRRFTLDRTRSGAEVPAVEYGTTRSITLTEPLHTLRLFVDRSSIEVFLNDGEAVASARIFPKSTSQGIVLSGEATVHLAIYSL